MIDIVMVVAQALIAGLGLSSDRLTFTHSSPSRLLAASISSVATCLKCSICALYCSKKHIIVKQYPRALLSSILQSLKLHSSTCCVRVQICELSVCNTKDRP